MGFSFVDLWNKWVTNCSALSTWLAITAYSAIYERRYFANKSKAKDARTNNRFAIVEWTICKFYPEYMKLHQSAYVHYLACQDQSIDVDITMLQVEEILDEILQCSIEILKITSIANI